MSREAVASERRVDENQSVWRSPATATWGGESRTDVAVTGRTSPEHRSQRTSDSRPARPQPPAGHSSQPDHLADRQGHLRWAVASMSSIAIS